MPIAYLPITPADYRRAPVYRITSVETRLLRLFRDRLAYAAAVPLFRVTFDVK